MSAHVAAIFLAISITAIRKDLTRRAQTASSEWQRRMLSAEGELEEQMGDHRAVSSGRYRSEIIGWSAQVSIDGRPSGGQYRCETPGSQHRVVQIIDHRVVIIFQ